MIAAPQRHIPITVAVLLLALSSLSCETVYQHEQEYPLFRRMRSELAPLQFAELSDTPTIRRHYRRVVDAAPGARHSTGTVPTLGMRVAVHLWYPAREDPAGTVFVVHGYLGHALQHAKLIAPLLRAGYLVVVPELPGHGLSDGRRGAIGDFADYGTFLDDVTEYVAGHVPEPWHAVGHSTGGTTVYEFIRRFHDPYEAVILVAPLVRSKFYRLSRLGRFLSRPFLDTISTGYDQPLGVSVMPLAWFDRQVEWNQRAGDFDVVDRKVLILQGTGDQVVAWRYNRRFLEDAFSTVEYRSFRGAGHVPFREDPPTGPAAVEAAVSYILATDGR